ncbi:uncharacterized protein [Rutidosis leptorrhynchoides]|uniref:uncharacterized protein n=1 Tax=Rutidosis leptorrhynchoides TaxID=125765 RepID=UPI003A99A696
MAGVAAARFQTIGTMVRTAWCCRFMSTKPRFTQVRFMSCPNSSDAAKREIEELKKVANEMKEKAASHAASQSQEAAGAVENVADKAKQSTQDAWNVTKDVAQKVQDTVTGNAQASVDHVKDNIEATKRSMNTKNHK